MSTPNDQSWGFVRVGKSIPSIDVDCSGWAPSSGRRSRGKLVGVTEYASPAEGTFVPAPAAWLELAVSFEANTLLARVIEQTNPFIVAASR